MDWQPIETAPIKPFDREEWYLKHSDRLLLCNKHRSTIGTYRFTRLGKGEWENDFGRIVYPTHWMPLPEPPK